MRGAQHLCSQVQHVWTGFGVQCPYYSVWVRLEYWSFGAMLQFEQCATSSSCANLENLLQTDAIGPVTSLRNLQFMTGFLGLRIDRRLWRMTSAVWGFWHSEPKKLLKKCDIWLDLIEVWPSRNWSKRLVSLTDPFMWFCSMIWRWDISMQSLFWDSFPWYCTELHIAYCAAIPHWEKPPYSPDLTPRDFWLFSTLKMGLKGTHFANIEEIKLNAVAKPWKISKETFCRCFQQWQDRWSKCVSAQGSYFEGD
jgi:hypothetical protein